MVENEKLMQGLAQRGCRIEHADGLSYVSLPDDYAEFIYQPFDFTSYLGTSFLTPEELAASHYSDVLDRFLLELQDRNLGCYFSYDSAGFLNLGLRLNPSMLAPDCVIEAMEQIAYVIDVCLPLCDRVLESGELPGDSEVDAAFGINDTLH